MNIDRPVGICQEKIFLMICLTERYFQGWGSENRNHLENDVGCNEIIGFL